MDFLIQPMENRISIPAHDFGWKTIEMIKYTNWFYNDEVHQFFIGHKAPETFKKNFIPIGSIEFVEDQLGFTMKPWFPIPMNSKHYGRKTWILDKEDLNKYFKTHGKLFVKHIDKIKGMFDIKDTSEYIPDGKYFVSEIINIISEWRVIVRKGKILDIRPYDNSFERNGNINFPNINKIKGMIQVIENLEDKPNSYTIDVCVTEDEKTLFIEAHNFVACGLYGFDDNKLLIMLEEGLAWEREQQEIRENSKHIG